ncbi:MAG: hypothetical protein AAF215_11495 [Cyanobacteria bacterium P01_A01_bin.123]
MVGLSVLSLIHRQVSQALHRINAWFGWIVKVFGIRFCLGFALACLVLLAGWLPQIEKFTAVPDEGSPIVQLSSVVAQGSASTSFRSAQSSGHNTLSSAADHHELTYLEFDPAVAQRLSHSGLTHRVLTGSHLTRAHLFTDGQPASAD